MSIVRVATFLALLLFFTPQIESEVVHITTSDAIDLARIVARNEGYDVRNTKVYYFDLLMTSDGKPVLPGYTTIGFYINGNVRSSISISDSTGQTIDLNTCEVFDYPELKPFQQRIMRLSKARKKTLQELADDVACGSPKVLNRPNGSPTK